MQQKRDPYETAHLMRVGVTEWRVEGRRPTALEWAALLERVRAAGGTVLYSREDPPVDVVRACEHCAELTTQVMRLRTDRLVSLRTEAAIRAGRACAQYLNALGLTFCDFDVFEALPGDALAIRQIALREHLVEGFARVIRVNIDSDPSDREANFKVLAAYAEQEEFVHAFRDYARRCWEERERWLSRCVADFEREVQRLRASGFTPERFAQALEELLNETSRAAPVDTGKGTSATSADSTAEP